MKHNKIYKDGKYVPQRMCIACREIKPQSDMIRVAFNEGDIIVDDKKKNVGRGAYICKDAQCVEKAQKIRGLERGLKTYIPAEIYEECIKIGK